ncbi:high affinity cationic amino acid transporter 1-like isoform X2 [Lycorma delicatula]
MGLWRLLNRRKSLSEVVREESQLGKVLTTLDLTALGVGSTLGVGIYVLVGSVSKEIAGPGVILSFLFAAIASVFAGLCYAEFGARVPKAGSAYAYSYVTIGEFVAFVIGWNLIMEYVIGGASVARGLSMYLDSLMNGRMEEYFRSVISIKSDFLSEYFDILAFTICVLLGFALSVGLKESMILNNLLTTVNIGVVLFVIIAGSFKVNLKNWTIPKDELPQNAGEGGFLPFGIFGTIKGAATCFYGYVGFDCIATTGEEVKNPQRAIPIAIVVSLAVIFLAYFGVSSVLTLMWPYYLQDVNAPIPYAFSQVGWNFAQWIVTVGGVFGLCASMFGGMYPLPRIIYAMSQDGLLYKFLGHVHSKYKTPFIGTILSGFITGIMAAGFKLKHLVDMMSMGTLVAYTIVAACVLLLRYREPSSDSPTETVTHQYVEHTRLLANEKSVSYGSIAKQLVNVRFIGEPTSITSSAATLQTILFCIFSVILSFCLSRWEEHLLEYSIRHIVICCTLGVVLLLIILSISLQPGSTKSLSFKVPFVPLIPCLSIFINLYLMMLMDMQTWIRFTAWLVVGLFIYFTYGIKNSKENNPISNIDYDSNGQWVAE